MNLKNNKTKISVLTKNEFLFQKIRTELTDVAECAFCSDGNPVKNSDVILRDADEFANVYAGEMTMSRHRDADIALPFRIGTLNSRFTNADKQLYVIQNEKCARLSNRIIHLTDVELSLLNALLSRGGAFVRREELLHEVWDDSVDTGILNVYIHYLREKLESNGEKIIICSRNQGYAVDKKYIRRNKL